MSTPDAGAGLTAPSGDFSTSSVMKRRQVECSMAWELDCIACGVTPLDKDRIVVMGLVPNEYDNDENSQNGENQDEAKDGENQDLNDVEVQVISRAEGAVVYADVIPVLKQSGYKPSDPEAASAYSLLSTFALPRMEDMIEAEEEGSIVVEQDFDFSLFGSATKHTFEDSHAKWNLNSVIYDVSTASSDLRKDQVNDDNDNNNGKDNNDGDDDDNSNKAQNNDDNDDHGEDDDDQHSVDSDDYGCILRPSDRFEDTINLNSIPPILGVVAPADVIGVRTSDADDAIEHALSLNKVALALERGLRHKRKLRSQHIDDLVDHYLKAVLRIDEQHQQQTDRDDMANDNGAAKRSLSIRRLKLGAAATPKLLGGNTRLWKRWLREFTKIPGALFIISEQLPVRGTYVGMRVCIAGFAKTTCSPMQPYKRGRFARL